MKFVVKWVFATLLVVLISQAFAGGVVPLIEDPGCSVTSCTWFYVGDLRWQAFGEAQHYSSNGVPLTVTLVVDITCKSPYLGITLCHGKANASGMGIVKTTCYCSPAGEAAICFAFCSCSGM
ncbi:hypothetical protein [Thermosipho sp. (in: thermotogales)]|jgi:hypothetical protein|uniref:hypothetical protein n=1 Tax=Thermosipho sp. (in: thermotogales) TaxID=1968895 RepID=UPI00257F9721|nr:hypothetical protein [Thermosipho sp. (in: thermotogales)]MBZ4651005.1 hypothetical protein [Thermosipho sp. (in: thermotogales)]